MTDNSKGNEPTLRITLNTVKWIDDEENFELISEWGLSKEHQKTLVSIIRQMYDHPNTKYSSRLKKIVSVWDK